MTHDAYIVDNEGNKYELYNFYKGSDHHDNIFGLKPIELVKQIKGPINWRLTITEVGIGKYFYDRSSMATEEQIDALVEAIKAVLDYIQSQVDGGKPTTEKHNAWLRAMKTAGKAHKIAGVPKSRKKDIE